MVAVILLGLALMIIQCQANTTESKRVLGTRMCINLSLVKGIIIFPWMNLGTFPIHFDLSLRHSFKDLENREEYLVVCTYLNHHSHTMNSIE